MLFLIDSIDITKRDSILNTEPQRWIASRLAQNRNILSNGYLCFSGEEAVIHKSYGKNIMNADGITVIQSISPLYGTCALGLVEEVILYKKNVGYFGLQYSLYKDFGREISFREASDLIDSLIKQTWGIIRFNKD